MSDEHGNGRPESAREALLAALAGHVAADAAEARDVAYVTDFVRRHAEPFDRRIVEGHLTGSALVLSATGARVLLLRHRKLQRWLQPGGHADAGEQRGEFVALREAREETGLEGLVLHDRAPRPLDVDVHAIPARGDEPAHAHLDLRYLVLAPDDAPPRRCPQETDDLRWFPWDALDALGLDAGLRRALAKARRFVRAEFASGAQ